MADSGTSGNRSDQAGKTNHGDWHWPVLEAWPSELFVFGGATSDAAKQLLRHVLTLLGSSHQLSARDLAYSLAGRAGLLSAAEPSQLLQYAIVAGDLAELADSIKLALADQTSPTVQSRQVVEGQVALLFSGQGAQRVAMAGDLFAAFPHLRNRLAQAEQYLPFLFPPAALTDQERSDQRARITDTTVAQPLLGLVDLAIADLLRSFGIEADQVAGHSYGELPALVYAGAFAEDQLLYLSRARAEAILAAVGNDPGRMVAVRADAEQVGQVLAPLTDVWAVNLNAPRQTVVAGRSAAVADLLGKLDLAGLRYTELAVAAAFHTPLLQGADSSFAQVLEQVSFQQPAIPVWSNTTAQLYPTEPAAIRSRLAEHLVKPVLFTQQIEAMYAAGVRLFIEAGPGGTLTGLAAQTLKGRQLVTIAPDRAGSNGVTELLRALARYLATGRTIAMDQLFA
ncbi:MAG: ACP S-malonyltransferase, partial [Bifidobacteriaceae bacterium]|nr:ACP S-malonyltransferase [Bifidobacteriaceae bacterium]